MIDSRRILAFVLVSCLVSGAALAGGFFGGGSSGSTSTDGVTVASHIADTNAHEIGWTQWAGGTNVIADASYTVVDVVMTNDVTIGAPTNATRNGKKIQFRLYASGGDRAVSFASGLKLPSSSTLASPVTVSNNTTSVLLIDNYVRGTNWLVESYVWGY